MNDFLAIQQDLKWILSNYTKSSNIDEVNKYVIKENNIGLHLPHIKRKNYRDSIDNLLRTKNYYIVFNDFSLLHLEYMFNKENNVYYSCLSYLPFIDNELQENEQLSKYIRIDYAPNDYKEIIHTKCHLHIGIDKNEFRIPVQTIIYPKEFIYFILKYIYHEDSKFTSLISLNNKKEILLTDKEINKLRLIIG